MKHNLIDSRDRFRPEGIEYKVKIEVQVNMRFIWTVIKCAFQNKDILITHKFTNDPFLHGDCKSQTKTTLSEKG